MTIGILYPPYGYAASGALAVGRVSAALKTHPVERFITDDAPSDAMAARYWAALTSVAGTPALQPRQKAPGQVLWEGRHVIDQTDTLRFHRRAPIENPFESLLQHPLHR